MQTVLYVDNRQRTGRLNNSSFSIERRESLQLADHGVRVDTLNITKSLLTTDLGHHNYYKSGAGIQHVSMP